MAYVNVDIDMDKFNTYELIEALENRSLCLNDSDKQKLLDIISDTDSAKWDKYSLMELEGRIDEAERIAVSKEQLSLPL